jgi:pimeloyl-ACP methyl ester carboxylesterase
MTARNFEDGWVELDGLRFHYTEWGSPTAPGVLMLHGLNVQCHTWDPIARELAGDFHVVCMDMRGHGDSDWAKTGYRVRSMARDVHGLIEVLGLGPVHLVGHSAGVRVAIAVAAERPETVLRLALSDAGPANSKSGAIAMLEFIRATTNLRGFRSEEEARNFYLGFHSEWRSDFIDLHVQYQLRRNWAGKLVPKADPDVQWITSSARRRLPVGVRPETGHADPAHGGPSQQRPRRGGGPEDAGFHAELDRAVVRHRSLRPPRAAGGVHRGPGRLPQAAMITRKG